MRAAGSGPVVVDTNVFGAQLTRRDRSCRRGVRASRRWPDLVISFITAAELRYGARLAGWGAQRFGRLEARLAVAEIVRAGDGLVDEYVSLRHQCSASGHPLGQKHHEANRWIAATARWLDVPLVAHDAVFRDAPSVRVITELA